jgi:hypothetical protein
MAKEVRTAAEIRASMQLLTHSAEKPKARKKSFRGSGYAWILTHYCNGNSFTIAEIQQGLIDAGILVKNEKGGYNDYASDCITRMMRTSDASNGIRVHYKNWTGTVFKEGREDGENRYALTSRGVELGKKLLLSAQNGLPIRGHHLVKRIDKNLSTLPPARKRGFRTGEKAFDVLRRSKIVRSRSKSEVELPKKSKKAV